MERGAYVAKVKKRILDEIAKAYPWLRAECNRQKARDGVEDDPGVFPLSFGPFRGRRPREIPTDYLIGLLAQAFVHKGSRTRIERVLAQRQAFVTDAFV
jgi:hypothetical protein